MDTQLLATAKYAEIRPYVAPGSLDDLTGPTGGRVALPGHLDWGPRRMYNLDDPSDVRLLYMRVIRESTHVEELCRFLHAALLRRLWSELVLPSQTRDLWETRFPDLATAE